PRAGRFLERRASFSLASALLASMLSKKIKVSAIQTLIRIDRSASSIVTNRNIGISMIEAPPTNSTNPLNLAQVRPWHRLRFNTLDRVIDCVNQGLPIANLHLLLFFDYAVAEQFINPKHFRVVGKQPA